MCFQAAYSSPIFSCSSVFLSNVLVFGMISLCFGFGFCNLAVHAINTLCLSIQINGFLLAFLFRALLLQPSIFSTVFMVSVQFCFVFCFFFVCLRLQRPLCVCSCLFRSPVLLFSFYSLVVAYLCFSVGLSVCLNYPYMECCVSDDLCHIASPLFLLWYFLLVSSFS